MLKKILIVIGMILLIASTALAQPIQYTMEQLIELGQVTIDDKNFIFTEGSYSSNDPNTPASAVLVTLLSSDPLNPGFQFQSGWTADGGQSFDTLITYDVQVIGGAELIKDVSLQIGGVGVNNGSVDLDENVLDVDNNLLVSLHVDETDLFDNGMFAPTDFIRVSKDLSYAADAGADNYANISQIVNRHSQVPEPATLLMLGSGLLGLGFLRRKSKRG